MRIGESLTARYQCPLEEVVAELLELCPCQCLHEMFRNSVNRHDVRQVDFGGSLVGKFNLRLLCSLLESLESHRILCKIRSAILGGELLCKPLDDLVVEVVTSEVGIAVGGHYLEETVTKVHDRDIECTATKVEHSNLHALVHLVKTEC